MTGAWLGVVADDVTGACDTAGVVTAEGVPTVVLLGPPLPGDEPAAADCVVVALTTRAAPRTDAVEQSTAAARWLLDHGARRLYQKYCSTFDSTAAGNIGPVADALADLVGGSSVGTPATPAVGRTVYQGHLFVDGRLLSESPLRDHPLNPMTDADLPRLLGAQTERPVGLVRWPDFSGATRAERADAVRTAVNHPGGGHVLLDAIADDDLDVHADALLDGDALLAGASGLAAALARRRLAGAGHAVGERDGTALPAVAPGRRLMLAGSCSRRTREQISHFRGTTVRVDVDDLAADAEGAVTSAMSALEAAYDSAGDTPVLVTTTLAPDELRAVQARHGRDRASRLAEQALAAIAHRAVNHCGVRRLIVAGGETAGAVTHALGVRQVHVGEQVAPGVPWTVSAGDTALALLLKSGNFGEPELFTTAWETCP